LSITECAPCSVACPPGATLENEVCDPTVDIVNGGCNYTPFLFSTLNCGETYCGTFVANDTIRDTDWYRLVTIDTEIISLSLTGEAAAEVILVAAGTEDCITYTIVADVFANTPCQMVSYTSQCLDPGVYWIVVVPQAFPTTCGDYVLSVTCTPCTPCNIVCQQFDIIECAGEAPDSTTQSTDCNGGCNNTGAQSWQPISCGQTVCGIGFTYLTPGGSQYRDTDWYLFTAAAGDSLLITVDAEFDVLFGLVDHDPCATAAFIGTPLVNTNHCVPMTYYSPCLTAGVYTVFVAPSVFSGIATPKDYRVTVVCIPCSAPVPPTNDDCATAALIVTVPNGSVTASGNTALANISCVDTCTADNGYVSNGPDVFYYLNLAQCRRIAMAMTGGDMHLAVFNGANNCCIMPPMYCNDDDGNFTPLPAWDVPAQHAGGLNSYIAAELGPGVYPIRVGYFSSSSGPYSLTVYDNGPCVACVPDSVEDVTVYRVADNAVLRWTADSSFSGTYSVWASTASDGVYTEIASGVPPVLGPDNTTFTDVSPWGIDVRKFYYVAGVCP
jgi:hypothetical protein